MTIGRWPGPLRRALARFGGIALALMMAPPQARAEPRDPAGHQILVMLRLPPVHFRPHASYGGAYDDSATQAARHRSAERLARRNGFTLVENWPMPLLDVDCYVMQLADGVTVEGAITQVSRDRRVAWAEPMHLYRTRGVSGQADPLSRAQPATREWHLADLHRVATGRGVKIAVIDSRVDADHPDLAGQVAVARDFVTGRPGPAERHGTGVAGVIAAKGDNGVGTIGVAPAARLMALRACWQIGADTVCDTLSLAKALHFAVENGARIINLSLGGPADRLLSRLIEIALSRNASVVAAFDPAAPDGGFPASQPGVLAVGDESLLSSARQVYGAPARDIPTTEPGGKWDLVSGSSYAAAHVSGLLALMRERGSNTGATAGQRLVTGATGAVDACASLVRTTRDCACGCAIGRAIGLAARR